MDYLGFKKAIGKSIVKNLSIGILLLSFGIFVAWLRETSTTIDNRNIPAGGFVIFWVMVGLFTFLGSFIIIKGINDAQKLRSDNLPILNAIKNGDKTFLIWIYEYITSVKGGVPDHQVRTYTRNGVSIIFSVRKKRVQDVMSYLKQEFPGATLGWTAEIEQQMNEYFDSIRK